MALIRLTLLLLLFSCGQSTAHKTKEELAKEEREHGSISSDTTTVSKTDYAASSSSIIRVISYNVLKYGDGCQGPDDKMHGFLETIVHYTNPDLLGLVKVNAFKIPGGDASASGPQAFDKAILDNALNKAFSNRYACCPTTDLAQGNNMNLLFYDKSKFGYSSMINLCYSETDFDLFKLYLKDHTKPDSVFLYVILNHTKSGDKSKKRDEQMTCIIDALGKQFKKLPNVIDMGDFNLHATDEPGYQALVTNPNENLRFYDPPFAVDKKVAYPANWLDKPDQYSSFLTTSTRKDKGDPNDCGTGGGARLWFDHILLSAPLISAANTLHYVPGTYHTIGNDGKRVGLSVNEKSVPNKLVPSEVADAIFNFSNKYPVTLELEIK